MIFGFFFSFGGGTILDLPLSFFLFTLPLHMEIIFGHICIKREEATLLAFNSSLTNGLESKKNGKEEENNLFLLYSTVFSVLFPAQNAEHNIRRKKREASA